MSWIHDCCYTTIPDGSRIKHDLQTRSFGDWITTCPHCGKPKPMTYPERVATLTADLARLTAELERKQRECEGLRVWAESLEKDWLTREQWALIDGGMRLEQALIHANARMKQARAATIKAALSAGENDGHA